MRSRSRSLDLERDVEWQVDLGLVHETAEVSLNGRALGVAWKGARRLPCGEALVSGRNRLKVEVANLWTAALVKYGMTRGTSGARPTAARCRRRPRAGEHARRSLGHVRRSGAEGNRARPGCSAPLRLVATRRVRAAL